MFRFKIDRRTLTCFDFPLFFLTVLIPTLGLVILYSAGYDPEDSVRIVNFLPIEVKSLTFARQLVFTLAGIVGILAIVAVDTKWYLKIAWPLYILTLIAISLVPFIGNISNGAQRWLNIGGIQFQPSEPIKLGVILLLARYISKNPPPVGGYGFKAIIAPFAIFAIPMIIVEEQPDLGTALCIGGVGMMMMLFAGIRTKVLVFLFCLVLSAGVYKWFDAREYQRNRVFSLFNPGRDPHGTGYHIIQSKITVGSGQFLGKGFLKGTQTHLMFLPEHTTDFVFSVLAEEWGFLGSITILILYGLLLATIFRAAKRAPDLFGIMVCVGVGSILFIHCFINIGMVIGILPVVGITLPLFSYGGTSIVTFLLCLGFVLGISSRRWRLIS